MFCVNVILTVKDPHDVEAVRGMMVDMVRLSREEPGCLRYEVYHSQSDVRVFMLIERWASEEAWKAHREERGFREIYAPRVLPLVDRVPHISGLVE